MDLRLQFGEGLHKDWLHFPSWAVGGRVRYKNENELPVVWEGSFKALWVVVAQQVEQIVY